jgi:hypothetical protein
MDGNSHGDRDINVRAVTKAGLGIGGAVIIAAFLMWFLFDRFANRETRQSAQPEPMAASNPRKVPPEPRLQSTAVTELKQFRESEEALLHSYGWVDSEKGIVRIPVERAMELVAKEGLPSRKEGRSQ